MKSSLHSFLHLLGWAPLWLVVLATVGAAPALADPVPVRYTQGTFHGFLELRAPDGRVVAVGDATSVVHDDRVTAETVFHFADGSVDDETAIFTQRRNFQLLSDHHIQRGPYFPHPSDVMIDVSSGTITVRSHDKNGREQVQTSHMTLPSDLSNGIVAQVLEDLDKNASVSTVSMVVMTPKPRVVKLVISNDGTDNCRIVGGTRKATHYQIKIELGGLIGVIAPLLGKAPPNIEAWIIGGVAPTFARETGPLYADGPLMTMQLASPVWGR